MERQRARQKTEMGVQRCGGERRGLETARQGEKGGPARSCHGEDQGQPRRETCNQRVRHAPGGGEAEYATRRIC